MTKVVNQRSMSGAEFRRASAQLHQPIRDLIYEYGPMNVATMRYLLRARYDTDVSLQSLREITYLMERDVELLEHKLDRLSLPGQKNQVSTLPHPEDYAEAFLNLHLRWEAVRANPDLLELTDEYIDALHLPGKKGERQ